METLNDPAFVAANFVGAIDEFAVYTRALTTTEVAQHYNAGSGALGAPTPYFWSGTGWVRLQTA